MCQPPEATAGLEHTFKEGADAGGMGRDMQGPSASVALLALPYSHQEHTPLGSAK